MKRSLDILLKLIIYPLLSLVIVYFLLYLSDKDISRWLYTILITVALLLPVAVLAWGIAGLAKKKTMMITVIAAALSTIIWIVIGFVFNKMTPTSVVEPNFSSIIGTFFMLTISVTIVLVFWEKLVLENVYRRVAKKKAS